MSRIYLLDTNIVSEAARDPRGQIAFRMLQTGESRLFTSVIVLAELQYGLRRNPQTRMKKQIEELIATLDIRDLPYEAAGHYAEIRHVLESRGQPIGRNDYWIAAHARAEDAVLVSNNSREFERIPGLDVDNWVTSPS